MKRPQSALVRLTQSIPKGSFYTAVGSDNAPPLIENFSPKNRIRVKKLGLKSQLLVKNAVEKEQLKEDVIHGKQLMNIVSEENKRLKTQIERFRKEVNRYENVDELLLTSTKLVQSNSNSKDGSLIPTLKFRVRQQQIEIDTLKTQHQSQVKQIKSTKVSELECQITQYQEETERLKTMLQDVLELNELDVYTQGRLFTCLNKIDLQKKEIQSFIEVTNIQNIEIIKLQQNYQLCVAEKGYQQKKFQDQIHDLMLQVQLLQQKDEQGDAFILQNEIDVLNEKLIDKDKTILNHQDLLKQTKRDYQLKIHTYLMQIQQSQTLQAQKEDQILLIEKQIESFEAQNLLTKDLEKKYLTQNNKQDNSTQFPQFKNKTIIKDDLKQISNKLKYVLRRKNIAQKDIPKYLFPNMNQNESATFVGLNQALENFPFLLSMEESFLMASYLLQPEDYEIGSQTLVGVPLGVLSSRAMHMVPSFEVINIQDESLMHTEITRKLLKQHQAIEELVAQIKKQEKCKLRPFICTQNQLQEASRLIYDIPFTNKQIDYISQISYEKCGDPINLDLQQIFQSFNMNFIQTVNIRQNNMILIPALNYFTYYKEAIIIPTRIRISSIIKEDAPCLQSQNSQQSLLSQSPPKLSISQQKAKSNSFQLHPEISIIIPKKNLQISNFFVFDYYKPKQDKSSNLQIHQIYLNSFQPVIKFRSFSFIQLESSQYVPYSQIQLPYVITITSEFQHTTNLPYLQEPQNQITIIPQGPMIESRGYLYPQNTNLLEVASISQQSLNSYYEKSIEILTEQEGGQDCAKITLNQQYQNIVDQVVN